MEAAKGSPPSLKGRCVLERMCWSENGKAPHANQEPSRMGNGGQVPTLAQEEDDPKSANIMNACAMRGSRWRKDASLSIFLRSGDEE